MASPSTASSTLLSLPSPVQPPLASRIPSYWPRLMERVLAMKQHDSSVAEEIRSSAPREILPAVLATKVLLARWRASNPNFPTIPTPLTGVLDEMRRTRNLYVITPVAVCSSNAKQCRRWPMLPSPIYQPTDPFPQNFAPVTIGVAPLTDSDPCRINVDPHPMDTIPREAEYNDTLQTSHDTFELSDSAKSKVRELSWLSSWIGSIWMNSLTSESPIALMSCMRSTGGIKNTQAQWHAPTPSFTTASIPLPS
ncbi:hypothetical protein DL93DRAFT_2151029 [Clavulina sp. PMI_390]|nr:hypothetical protein DL93DRAFT_2151029 [Clavulina sp. PMI_390]